MIFLAGAPAKLCRGGAAGDSRASGCETLSLQSLRNNSALYHSLHPPCSGPNLVFSSLQPKGKKEGGGPRLKLLAAVFSSSSGTLNSHNTDVSFELSVLV